MQGSVSLYYKPLKVLFTGDHLAKSYTSELTIFEKYNHQSGTASGSKWLCHYFILVLIYKITVELAVAVQLNSVRKFLDLDFKWILPG